MSSLKITENTLYEFIKKITEGMGYSIYRGTLPKPKFKDRENATEESMLTKLYPCLVLRILSSNQERTGFNSYDCEISFEIIIGTKSESYLENIEMSDFIKEKLMEKLYEEEGFSIRQDREFKIEYYSDEYDPFIFSKITFSLYGFPTEPNYNFRKE